jgi:polygalacturonase
MNASDIPEETAVGSRGGPMVSPLLARKSVLIGMLTSGFLAVNAAQSSAVAAGTVKPIAATQPSYALKWTPSTAYVRGQQVISPNNDVVSAKLAHTSSPTYDSDSMKWTLSSTYTKKGSLVLNVLDFGSAGDGVMDDTATIQAALDSGAGRSVYFPPGTYAFSTIYPKSGSLLYGLRGATVLAPIGNNSVNMARVRLDSVDGVTLRDFTIGETAVVGRSGVHGCISGIDSTAILVQNVEVTASSATGMHFIHCKDVVVDGCHIHHTKADGIHFQRGSTDCRVSNSLIEHVDDDSIGFVSHGFDTYGYARNLTVTNCVLGRQTPGMPGSGVALIGILGATISNNIITDTALSGIRVTEFFGSGEGDAIGGNIAITGNTILNSGLYSGSVSGVVTDGVSVFNQRNVLISGNLIDKTTHDGISICQSGINVTVSDNVITRAAGRGIMVASMVRAGNYLRLWTEPLLTDGFSLDYVNMHEVVIQDNVVRGSGTDGIYLMGSAARYLDECRIIGNSIYNANSSAQREFTSGMNLVFARRSVVSGNYVGQSSGELTPWNFANHIDVVVTSNIPVSIPGQRTAVGSCSHDGGTALPNSGTFAQGDVVWNTNPQPGSPLLWACSAAGTMGSLNGGATTGTIAKGSSALLVSSSTGLSSGAILSIAGLTSRRSVIEVAGLVITLDAVADASVTNAGVSYSPGRFCAAANLL